MNEIEKGRWVKRFGAYMCDQCGQFAFAATSAEAKERLKFCPNCGCEMEVESDE